MLHKSISIRTFIGAKDFAVSRSFYHDLGFREIVLSEKMSYFQVNPNLGFYLQDYFVRDWTENSMLFLEVEDLDQCLTLIMSKKLPAKYPNVRLSDIKNNDWGREFFLHDPSGILWHIGTFQ